MITIIIIICVKNVYWIPADISSMALESWVMDYSSFFFGFIELIWSPFKNSSEPFVWNEIES